MFCRNAAMHHEPTYRMPAPRRDATHHPIAPHRAKPRTCVRSHRSNTGLAGLPRETAPHTPCQARRCAAKSITARSSVIPCDLWMVIAHAQRNGTWLTLASTVSPSIISQQFGFMVTILPFSNSTIGHPPCFRRQIRARYPMIRSRIGGRCRCVRPSPQPRF